MNRLHRTFLAGTFAAIPLLGLLGCGEDYLFSESSVPSLKQHIFVLPDRYTGQPYNYSSSPVSTVYLDTNESVKLWAAYSLDGAYIASDTSDNHYLSHSWNIDGEEYNISPLRFSFSEPGIHYGILQTVDLMGDTLTDTLNIFVNTPLSIRAVAPVNGYNMADPSPDAQVQLSWDISGADPWEHTHCIVFAAYSASEVWESSLGDVDCNDDIKLFGPFVKEDLYEKILKGSKKDTSVNIYWAVMAYATTDKGFREKDSTEIFRFSTRYIRTDSARIDIPVVYEGLHGNEVRMQVVVMNAQGDTLKEISSKSAETQHMTLAAQTGIRISASESRRTEYTAEEQILNVLPGTYNATDTIRFTDKVQPQVALRSGYTVGNEIDYKPLNQDTIYFYALDNGSGINPNKISVTMDADSLLFVYNEPFIKFRNTCRGNCKVRVSVEDYAHNASPKLYWNISMIERTPVFTGPFSELGGEQ